MFLNYIHNFRAVAMIFIVFTHTMSAFNWSAQEDLLIRSIFANTTVLFVFISGFLMQHLFFKFEYKKYYLKKFKYVVIPYLIISIPAIIIFTFLLERESNYIFEGFYQEPIFIQINWFYLTGYHLAPFWFMPMILLFLLMAPFFKLVDKHYITYITLPILLIISYNYGRGGMPYQNFLHFLSIFMTGMFFSKYKNIFNVFLQKNFLIIIFFIIISALIVYENNLGRDLKINFIQKMFLSIFTLGILYKLRNKINLKFLNIIADFSFGIFFIHGYLISGIKFLYLKYYNELPSGSLLIYFFASLLILELCIIIIFITKKILGNKSKFIIGC